MNDKIEIIDLEKGQLYYYKNANMTEVILVFVGSQQQKFTTRNYGLDYMFVNINTFYVWSWPEFVFPLYGMIKC